MAVARDDFDRWVGEHGPALYRLAYRLVGDRHEAEDILQETFRSAWKSRRLFDAGRGERAWLAAILRRRVVDHWRHAVGQNSARRQSAEAAGEGQQPASRRMKQLDNEPEIGVPAVDPLADEYSDEMQHALDQLPSELKETLLLVVVVELTHQEAADLLEVPLGTVLSRVSRARVRLREFLLARAGGVGNRE